MENIEIWKPNGKEVEKPLTLSLKKDKIINIKRILNKLRHYKAGFGNENKN